MADGPSVAFDAVAIIAGEAGTTALLDEDAAVAWVPDAYAHLKVIGGTPAATLLLDATSVIADEGMRELDTGAGVLIETAATDRIGARQADVRKVY